MTSVTEQAQEIVLTVGQSSALLPSSQPHHSEAFIKAQSVISERGNDLPFTARSKKDTKHNHQSK